MSATLAAGRAYGPFSAKVSWSLVGPHRTMGRRLAVALALLSMAAPLAAAEPWLGQGGGPARSFYTPDSVPAIREFAFQVELPVDLHGSQFGIHHAVVLDGFVYVIAIDGIYQISLADATSEKIASIPAEATPHAVLSDGERLFAYTSYGVMAFALDGAPVWENEFPTLITAGSPVNRCSEPVTGAGAIFLHCTQSNEDLPPAQGLTPTGPREVVGEVADQFFLIAYDLATGEERWRVVKSAQQSSWIPQHLAFVDGVLVVESESRRDPSALAAPNRRHVDALDPADGTLIWSDGTEVRTPSTSPEVEFTMSGGKRAGPVGSGSTLFALLDDLHLYDARSGDVLWQAPFDEKGHIPWFAARPDGLVVAWADQLWQIDPEGVPGGAGSAVGFLEKDRMWNGLATAKGAVVALAHDMRCSPNPQDENNPDPEDCERFLEPCPTGPGRLQWLYVFNDDGTQWVDEFCAVDPDFSLGEGLIVVSAYPRTVMVYGRTPASIAVASAPSDAYPAPGETVTLDLGATRPGVLAEDLEYRVDWGDGTTSDPQATPVFTHVYEEGGEYVALATVTNSAGQSSVEAFTFHVGGTPPAAPTWLSTQFDSDHQNVTFFVLGLAVTGAAGAVGVARMQRRRKRLARELAALEEVYQMTHLNSVQCDQALGERVARARGLLLEGTLDETQFAVVERRVEELSRKVRIEAIDEQMGFLPVSMARTLRALLADGRIERWERAHFVEALDKDPHLTPEQKGRVKTLIDEWFQRDVGRA